MIFSVESGRKQWVGGAGRERDERNRGPFDCVRRGTPNFAQDDNFMVGRGSRSMLRTIPTHAQRTHRM